MTNDELPLTPSYRLNSATVLRDLHRLIAAFFSLSSIDTIVEDEADPLHTLRTQFTEVEIVHQLINTAIMNRLQMEHMHRLREDPDELSFQLLEAVCGELCPDIRNDETIELDFREACNKIIHAQQIEIFDWNNPVLRLEGTLGTNEWCAFVEITDYVRASVRNFEDALA